MDEVSVALRLDKSALLTGWNDFDNPTLNHTSAESVRSATSCV